MWSKWSTTTSSGPTAPKFSRHFSLKDVHSLITDSDSDDPIPSQDPGSPSLRRASVLRRVRAATSALRIWRSSSSAAAASSPPPPADKIVLYFTSLRVVRKTFDECRAVRSILRGFRLLVDERDVSMDSSYLHDLNRLLRHSLPAPITLPRVFVGGRYIGGFDEIQQLHESGELKRILHGLIPLEKDNSCEVCGGMRFVLCRTCCGSHKYYSEKKGFRTCNACNENGLVRCPDCGCGD